MAVLEILVYPDERLQRVSESVVEFDDALRQFLKDLELTMRAGPAAVGIAAPQVGRSQRIAIVHVSTMLQTRSRTSRPLSSDNGRMLLINPHIMAATGEFVGREGCLSVPDYTGNVLRAQQITVSAQDVYGVQHEYQCEGFEARAIQHELDHLDGLLFLDRLVSPQQLFRRKTKTYHSR